MIYLRTLVYILIHKWYVMLESFKMGNYWRGITHDMSKFRPSEFIHYAKYFNGDYPTLTELENTEDYFKVDTKEGVAAKFDYAWLYHIHRNKHHWQHWVLYYDDGESTTLCMPVKYVKEMVADWLAMQRYLFNGGLDDTREWYLDNRSNMQLHTLTEDLVEKLLGVEYNEG